jgi:hypothetical protein
MQNRQQPFYFWPWFFAIVLVLLCVIPPEHPDNIARTLRPWIFGMSVLGFLTAFQRIKTKRREPSTGSMNDLELRREQGKGRGGYD